METVDEHQQEVRQLMVTLPYFHYDVPVLYLRDGAPYIPIIALCRILGLRSETHLPRWRRSLLWKCARKLPMYTPQRGSRLVWCIHFGALPIWYGTFNWKEVSPERREQLHQASCELLSLPDRVHREMIAHYRHLRRFLFRFLASYADAHTFLNQLALQWYPTLDKNDYEWLEELISHGRTTIDEATELARKMLQAQGKIPIIDA
jgi:hypothetical protein